MRPLYFILTVLLLAAPARASFFYDFHRDHDNQVLATLELARLPADYTDVVQLTFTPAGELVYGMGPIYQGSWDMNVHGTLAIDDGALGLGSAVITEFRDTNPPSGIYGDNTWGSLIFSQLPQEDSIEMVAPNLPFRWALGEWKATTPEPAALVSLASLLLVVLFVWIKRSGGRT